MNVNKLGHKRVADQFNAEEDLSFSANNGTKPGQKLKVNHDAPELRPTTMANISKKSTSDRTATTPHLKAKDNKKDLQVSHSELNANRISDKLLYILEPVKSLTHLLPAIEREEKSQNNGKIIDEIMESEEMAEKEKEDLLKIIFESNEKELAKANQKVEEAEAEIVAACEIVPEAYELLNYGIQELKANPEEVASLLPETEPFLHKTELIETILQNPETLESIAQGQKATGVISLAGKTLKTVLKRRGLMGAFSFLGETLGTVFHEKKESKSKKTNPNHRKIEKNFGDPILILKEVLKKPEKTNLALEMLDVALHNFEAANQAKLSALRNQ